jgi:hypothetical protein
MMEADQPATQRLRLHMLRLWESRLLAAYCPPVHQTQWRACAIVMPASHLTGESINYGVCMNLSKQLLVVCRKGLKT